MEVSPLTNFWRTLLPLILLAALIIAVWPTEPLDFGSSSPWDGLVILVEDLNHSGADAESAVLLIASIPATDDQGKSCSLIIGTAVTDGSDPLPLLLSGETDALRLQRIQLVDDPIELFRSIRGELRAFPIREGLAPERLLGGILLGQMATPPGTIDGEPRDPIDIGNPLLSTLFEARCDPQEQLRWHSERHNFRELWVRARDDDPGLLEPFIHGRVSMSKALIPGTDAVVPRKGR